MENSNLGRYTVSFGVSAAIVSVLSALLVVLKEINESTVLAWMKSLTGHHWITHGVFVVVAFLALGWILTKIKGGQGLSLDAKCLTKALVAGVALGVLIVSGFYLVG